MKRNDDVNEWLHFAEMDLTTAEFLWQQMRPQPLEIICYHCQQAAEKSLKSILIAQNCEVVKTHDLAALYVRVVKICPEIATLKNSCEKLNRYGSQPRYPKEIHIDITHTQRAIQDAHTTYETIKNLFEQTG